MSGWAEQLWTDGWLAVGPYGPGGVSMDIWIIYSFFLTSAAVAIELHDIDGKLWRGSTPIKAVQFPSRKEHLDIGLNQMTNSFFSPSHLVPLSPKFLYVHSNQEQIRISNARNLWYTIRIDWDLRVIHPSPTKPNLVCLKIHFLWTTFTAAAVVADGGQVNGTNEPTAKKFGENRSSSLSLP